MTWVPQACTLPTAEQPLRVAEFDALLAAATRPAQRVDATTLRVYLPAGDATASTARSLVERETRCCSFFAFDLHAREDGTELLVRVPPAHVAVLDALQERCAVAS